MCEMPGGAAVDLFELLSVCVDLSMKAGEVVREVARGEMGLHAKDEHGDLTGVVPTLNEVQSGVDVVTSADLLAQGLIEGSLVCEFPGLRLVGEEVVGADDLKAVPADRSLVFRLGRGGEVQRRVVDMSEVVVYVDPLDGTREYVVGDRKLVFVMIGISYRGVAYAGVVHQPFEGECGRTIWCMEGYGCFDDHPDRSENLLTRVAPSRDTVVLVTTRSHHSEAVDVACAYLSADEVIRVGGAGYKILCLARGVADVYCYPSPGTKKWDTCAPEAILRVATGGKLTDFQNLPIDYDDTENVENYGILATRESEYHAVCSERLFGGGFCRWKELNERR
ncbi:3'(2'),5'-bisphosphate nucleotidase 1-like [Schistocerca gregaria]|uniref:3'(2'),5'-bisphosphate nucleotidase 1-like n=1 Tax=Schistocerca gregaria TaxID=7010 RepID=UPI00211DBA97|nr:3'(2'),5'-bisphosphate nucleotidase 1-like [Schistocerca gregaria]